MRARVIRREPERPLLQPLVPERVPVAVPVENLHPVAALVAEDEEMPRERVGAEDLLDHPRQAVAGSPGRQSRATTREKGNRQCPRCRAVTRAARTGACPPAPGIAESAPTAAGSAWRAAQERQRLPQERLVAAAAKEDRHLAPPELDLGHGCRTLRQSHLGEGGSHRECRFAFRAPAGRGHRLRRATPGPPGTLFRFGALLLQTPPQFPAPRVELRLRELALAAERPDRLAASGVRGRRPGRGSGDDRHRQSGTSGFVNGLACRLMHIGKNHQGALKWLSHMD